jgi:photosystem II stability/assembly factor-like uncharacterized protein
MKTIYTLILSTSLLVGSVKAQTWENTNCTGTGVVYDLEESGSKIIVARANDGILSSTNGTSWTTENVGSTGSFRSIKNFGGVLYTATNASNIYTSNDNGVNWSLLGGNSGLSSVYMTTFYKNSSVMIYGTSSGSASTYYSTNGGSNWNTSQFDYGSGLQSGFENGQKNIVELSGVLYFSSLKDVFKSTDNGATWTVITTAPNIPDGTVTSLSTTNDALILTIYGYGTHKSTDGGANWTMILGGSLGTITNNMTISYYKNGHLFVGGALGMVYVSTDGGTNWTDISIGGSEVVQCFKHFNGYIYAGTNMNLYRYNYSIGAGTVPNDPSDLLLTPTKSSTMKMKLDWTDNSTDELEFAIQRSLDGSNWIDIDSVGADITTYTDINLAENTVYHYRVYAYNASGNSGYTNAISATTLVGITLNNKAQMSIYPNPTNGFINIENYSNNNYDIFDIVGKKIASGSISNNTIDISNHPNGVYFVKIDNQSYKIIKN